MSSAARITSASRLCPSPAHQGQGEVWRAQLNPKRACLRFLPNPFSLPQEESDSKAPPIFVGVRPCPTSEGIWCSAQLRGQCPGPIKVNGNQRIQASLDAAGRACSRALAKPCPVPVQLNGSGAKLLRSWLMLLAQRCPPVQESLVTWSRWNRSRTSLRPPCKEPETSFHLLAPPQQIKVLRGRGLAG